MSLQWFVNTAFSTAADLISPADRLDMMIDANFKNTLNAEHSPAVQGHINAIHQSVVANAKPLLEDAGHALHEIQSNPELMQRLSAFEQHFSDALGPSAGPVKATIAEHMGNIREIGHQIVNGHGIDMQQITDRLAPELADLKHDLAPYSHDIQHAIHVTGQEAQEIVARPDFQHAVQPVLEQLKQIEGQVTPHVQAIMRQSDHFTHDMHWRDSHEVWNQRVAEWQAEHHMDGGGPWWRNDQDHHGHAQHPDLDHDMNDDWRPDWQDNGWDLDQPLSRGRFDLNGNGQVTTQEARLWFKQHGNPTIINEKMDYDNDGDVDAGEFRQYQGGQWQSFVHNQQFANQMAAHNWRLQGASFNHNLASQQNAFLQNQAAVRAWAQANGVDMQELGQQQAQQLAVAQQQWAASQQQFAAQLNAQQAAHFQGAAAQSQAMQHHIQDGAQDFQHGNVVQIEPNSGILDGIHGPNVMPMDSMDLSPPMAA